ncbi:MAG: HAD family phosphatase [Ignavibacteriaceae bacterium]|nr:HAD family phosphatase [Ignavibacteriaceae bacterium]
MPEKKYSVIVFDLGKVLINFDYDIAVNRFNKIEPNLGNDFLAHFKKYYDIHREFERGKISTHDFIQFALKGINNKIDADTFSKIYADIFTAHDDVISLLPTLKKNYMLILLSNTDPLHKQYGWEKYEFLSYFDYKVLSFEAGSVKPEEKIYKQVEVTANVPPQELLYIDDIAEYTDAAKKLGWDAVQFLNYKQLVEELKNRKVLTNGQP